ncbi:MAG: cyclophilin-like family protein [Candidatus Thorarchaeota archaeon]
MEESDVPIEIEFEGGPVLRGVIDRVLAPSIVEEIKFRLPFEGRAVLLKGEMKIILAIGKGNQRPTKDVKRANIAYMPLGDSLCIYTKDMQTFSPVNIVGKIENEDALDELSTVRRGSNAVIRLSE